AGSLVELPPPVNSQAVSVRRFSGVEPSPVRSVPPTATAHGLTDGHSRPGYAWVATPFVEPSTGTPMIEHEEPVSPVEAKSVRPSITACSRILSPGTSEPSVKIALALPTFSHSPYEALPCSGPFLSLTQPASEARV